VLTRTACASCVSSICSSHCSSLLGVEDPVELACKLMPRWQLGSHIECAAVQGGQHSLHTSQGAPHTLHCQDLVGEWGRHLAHACVWRWACSALCPNVPHQGEPSSYRQVQELHRVRHLACRAASRQKCRLALLASGPHSRPLRHKCNLQVAGSTQHCTDSTAATTLCSQAGRSCCPEGRTLQLVSLIQFQSAICISNATVALNCGGAAPGGTCGRSSCHWRG
jgi:hypothetical protein